MVRISRVVPKEWEKYTPLGNIIPNTRFIVFKTPLNDNLLTRVSKPLRFSTSHLYRMLAERGQRLGMVVDLTDTDRYYDKADIEGMCIGYEKIYCPGRGFIEREEIIEQFNNAIERFTATNEDKDLLIGVHCTHGVNRSGYLICRFLIESLGWSSHEAIEAFERARGHPIDKGAYIQALHRAFKESRGKRVRHSDSDNESEVKRKKHKKNKRKHRDEEFGTATAQMGDMIQQFLGELGQHAQQMDAAGSGSNYDSPAAPAFDSPAQHNWPSGSAVTQDYNESPGANEDEEEEEDDIDGVDLDDVDESGEPSSKSAKRRARRRRQENMLRVMKRGNFHEIQEMIQERYGGK